MGLSVAVTGTTTFFGSDLVRALEGDDSVDRVLALDSKPSIETGRKTIWRKLDLIHPRAPENLTSELEANGADVIVHSATLARPIHRGGWAHEMESVGTRHVLAAAEAAGTRKVILRSTMLCYGALESNPNYLPETAPLEGGPQSPFIADKVEVETQTARFAQKHPECVVTILRFGPLLGQQADTIAAAYLSQRVCPTLLGFDPLCQVMHEEDAMGAVLAALHRDVRGAINVAAPGVVTLSSAIRLAGSTPLPLPRPMLLRALQTLWSARLGNFPPGLLDLLKYVCVGDVRRMERDLQFKPRLDAVAAVRSFAALRRTQARAA